MPRRQAAAAGRGTGREAQRRRTRAALVDATTRLLAEGQTPSVDQIAAAADVSRRTVYMHFPSLDQLLLDAAVGAMSAAGVDTALSELKPDGSAADRVDALARVLSSLAPAVLPMGRKIIRLTVDAPTTDQPPGEGRRGHRRIEWIERAVEPMRDQLSPEQHDRLVSALSLVLGWEAMVVLQDVRGLDAEQEERVTRWAARVLVEAMTSESGSSAVPR